MLTAGYLLMGALDPFVIIAFILRIYRQPLLQQLCKILPFCMAISIFSYVMRVVLQVPEIDLPAQYLFTVLFFALFLKIRIHHSAFIAGAGAVTFAFVQVIVYYMFLWVGLVDQTVLTANMGNDIFVLQASTQFVIGLIAYCVHVLKYGFTFIKFRTSSNDQDPMDIPMVLVILMLCITISVTIVMLYKGDPLSLINLSAISCVMCYYLSKRRSYDNSRVADLEKYLKLTGDDVMFKEVRVFLNALLNKEEERPKYKRIP